jgi:hypothetical protein
MPRIRLIIGLILAAAFVIAALVQRAQAECLQWGVDQIGTHVCMMDDLVNRNPIFPIAPSDPHVTITSHVPKCDEGWTLVIAGHPMCAHELKEPK